MMSRFLLLFCFATLHVLGQQVPVKNNDFQPAVIPEQGDSVQHSDGGSLSNTVIKPVEPVSVPLNADKNKLTPEDSSSVVQTSTNTSPTTHPTTPSTKPPITPPTTSTTTPSTTTSTTPSTTSTTPSTTSIPTTTPSTPVIPPGTPGKWVLVNDTGKVCIILQMAATFNVSYDVNNTKHFMAFDMPVDNITTKASGKCGELEQNLTLEWSTKNLTDGMMTLHFVKNTSTNHYSLHHLELVLPPKDFPNTTFNESMIYVHKEPSFIVGLTNSYRCLKQQKLNLKQNDTNEIAGYLTVSGLQFQAFKTDNSTFFGLAKDCAFDTPDVVPIAVGCALAGLVIIVLISYLIGRRRSQARGYLSM
ncbi:lysosome-associated membrane glycoprotein 1 [Calliopsis andreniformis]|uniref:lysosome-associated membrane glycoprotein 1 n=1 Tax=Calliopsis andreniformis TaxID=337506 RepID=UPI003FCC4008